MGDIKEGTLGVLRDAENNLVHFGAVVDGVFHPFAATRGGDYDERVAEHQQEQQAQQTQTSADQQPQPGSDQPPQPAPDPNAGGQ